MQLIKYYQKGDRIAKRTARKEQRYERRNPNVNVPQPMFPQVRPTEQINTLNSQTLPKLSGVPSGLLQKRATTPQEPVYDTFNQQFAQARKAGLKVFDWKGKSFGTELAKSVPEQQPSQSKGVGPRVEIFNPWEMTFPAKAKGPYPPIKSNQPQANTPPPNTKSMPGSSVNTGGPMSPNKPQIATPDYTKSRPGSSANIGGQGDASITVPPMLPGIGGIPSKQFVLYPTQSQPNPWQPQNKKKRLVNYRIVEQHQ